MANYAGNNLADIRTGLNDLFDKLDTRLKTIALANSLPLVGKGLSTIQDPAVDFLKTLKETVNAQLDTSSVEQLQQTLFNALNTWLQDGNGNGLDLQDVAVNDTADQVSFNITLKRDPVSVTGGVGFDVGLPGLGLEVKDGSTVRTDVDFSVTLGFGVEKDTGFFVDTELQDEVKLGLTTSLQNFKAVGKLGLLQVDVTDNAAQPTQFSGTFGLDLQDELNVIPTFTGEADVNLHIQSNGGEKKISLLPSIGADLNLGWEFNSADASNLAEFGNAPTLAFNNVTLKPGAFASQFIKPVLEPVQKALSPIKPVIDFLTDDLPLADMSLIDLVDRFNMIQTGAGNSQNTEGLKALEFLNTLLEVPVVDDNISLPLGNFNLLGGTDIRISSLKDLNLNAFESVLEDVEQGLKKIGAEDLAKYLDDAEDGLKNNGPTFPLIEDPKQAFQLLLGQEADLFKWDLSDTLRIYDEKNLPVIFALQLGYRYDARLNLLMGFDTKGLRDFAESGFEDPEKLLDGFYISDNVINGEDGPEALVDVEFSAGAGIFLPGFSASVTGKIIGDVSLNIDDENNDNKLRLSEIRGCLFNANGKIEATLGVELKVGFGIFSITKRVPITKGTLISFEAGCSDEKRRDPVRNQIARIAGDELQLLIGSRAGDRVISNTRGGDGNQPEFFIVRPDANNPNQVEVLAFGAIIPYEHRGRIVADGQAGGDAIAIDNAVLTPAVLQGNGGDDQLKGGGGNDRLDGGNDQDDLYGNAGNDTLLGGEGDDFLAGGAGSDVLDGGNGFDIVNYANPQNPTGIVILVDQNGNLNGVAGDALGDVLQNIEYIIGTQYGDTIQGHSGRNILEGAGGNDQLSGFDGDDVLQGGLGADILDGGNGSDWTNYIESRDAVDINLQTGRGFGGEAQGDVLRNLENVKGTLHNDRLTGNSANNHLDGSAGNDTINGSLGADALDGGADIDTLSYAYLPQAIYVRLKDGTSNKGDIITQAVGDDNLPIANRSSIENLEGTAFGDTLEGDIGANVLTGLAGNDIILGDDGNDRIIGGAGADFLDGGAGLDWADYSLSTSRVNVNLQAGVGQWGDAEGDRFHQNIFINLSTIENLRGSDFSDVLVGDDGNNHIDPGLSAYFGGEFELIDVVDGGDGSRDLLTIDYSRQDFGTGIIGGYDVGSATTGILSRNTADNTSLLDGVNFANIEELEIRGTIKDDVIYGGAGNDYILLGAGNDTVFGGRGSNTILAGDGNDFVVDQNDINLSLANEISVLSNSFIDLDGGSGIDTLSINLSGKGLAGNTIQNITLVSTNPFQENPNQHLVLSDGSRIDGFEVFQDVTTGAGNDTLIQLGRVNNTFITGGGNDTINPGLGIDVVSSLQVNETDNDLLIIDYSFEDNGTELVTNLSISKSSGRIFRNVIGQNQILDEVRFSDIERFNIIGTSKNDQIIGGHKNDILSGNAGNDRISGNGGNDFLSGGDGNDILKGTDSSLLSLARFNTPDVDPVQEVDTLSGGTGADTFVLGSGQTSYYVGAQSQDYALITDFNPAEGDKLEMAHIPSSYQLAIDDVNNNVGIYLNQDLIAVIEGTTNFDLKADYVRFGGSQSAQPRTYQSSDIARFNTLDEIADDFIELQSRGSTRTNFLSEADSFDRWNSSHPLLQADTLGVTALNQFSSSIF